MRVPRILVVSGLERERGVHEVQIDGVEPESVQTGQQRGFDSFGSMVVVHSFVVTNRCSRRTVPSANNSLSAAPTRASLRYRSAASRWREADLDRRLDGISGLLVVGKRRPEPERRDLTGAVVQGKSVLIEVLVKCHGLRSHSGHSDDA